MCFDINLCVMYVLVLEAMSLNRKKKDYWTRNLARLTGCKPYADANKVARFPSYDPVKVMKDRV